MDKTGYNAHILGITGLMAVVLLFVTTGFGWGACFSLDEPDNSTENDERQTIDDLMAVDDEPKFSEVDLGFDIEDEEPTKVAPAEKEDAPDETTRLDSGHLDDFVRRFDRHYSKNQRRLIHVTLDRPMYRPGQRIQWRSWHRSPGSLSGSTSDDDVEIELLSPRGDVVDDTALTPTGAMTAGSFSLDDDARGGQWTFRVTDGDDKYERPVLVSQFEPPRFLKRVDFDNPAYRPGDTVEADIEILRDTGDAPGGLEVTGYLQVEGSHIEDVEAVLDGRGKATVEFTLPDVISDDDAALVLSVEEGGLVETQTWPMSLALDDIVVEFFAEGGELVAGLTSRVYFEATDLSGEPVSIDGKIRDSAGRAVADIETKHRGRGRFELTPERDETYKLIVTDDKIDNGHSLPEARSEGCVLRVFDDFDSQSDAVRAGVWCTEGQLIGVVGAMGDQIFDVAQTVAGPEQPGVVYLRPDEDDWPRQAGTVRVTVFEDGEDEDPIAERVTFRGRQAQMDLRINLDKKVFHPGETVEFEIEATGPDGEPMLAELAKSVVDDRVHARAHHDSPSILGRLLLEADDLHFWGDVKKADDYFDLYSEQAALGLDLLMGSRGWRASDKRDGYYVDGGKEQIQRPRRRQVRRPRPRRQRQPQPEFAPRERGTIGMFGDAAGGGGAAVDEMGPARAAAPTPAPSQPPTPTADLDAAPSESSDDDTSAPGADRPRWARDDDAVAFAAWEPDLKTGSGGILRYQFELPEAIGAYRIAIEGLSESGLVGRTEEVVGIEVPLSVAIRPPEIMSGKDRLLLPVTIRNTTSTTIDATIEFDAQGPVTLPAELRDFSVEVPPRQTATRYVAIDVDDARGEGSLTARVQGGGFTDGAQRTFDIEPRGYQRTRLLSGQLPGTSHHDGGLDGMTDAGADARIAIYPNSIAEAMEGIESMARRPTGCFEQTSASNHPNVLIYNYLKSTGELDADTEEQLSRLIGSGYDRLLTFEIASGGYEWFGNPVGQAGLTGWGLAQFSAMEHIVDDFDDDVIDRSVTFLRSLQAVDGSWDKTKDRAWRRISESERTPAQLLVIYGLARAGKTGGFEVQLDDAAKVALESDELYSAALATAALAYADYDNSVVSSAIQRLERMQNSDGSWSPEQGRSWTWGYGSSLDIETTGLAALALIEADGSREAISNAIDWLGDQKTGPGWWGSTQPTIMALEARVAYERQGLAAATGPVYVLVDGEVVAETTVSTEDMRPIHIDDIGAHLSADTERISIKSDVPVDYDLELNWRVEQFDTDGRETLAVDFRIGDDPQATMGDEVSIEVDVKNLTDSPLGMTVARIALPAGLEVNDRELDALIDRSDVDLYETTAREVTLYFDEFDSQESQSLRFSATAAIPGVFETPASVAYPYYRSEAHWQWGRRSTFEIQTP